MDITPQAPETEEDGLANWSHTRKDEALRLCAVACYSGAHTVHESDQISKVHGPHEREVSNISRQERLLLVDCYKKPHC
jgi:hypothetical protein